MELTRDMERCIELACTLDETRGEIRRAALRRVMKLGRYGFHKITRRLAVLGYLEKARGGRFFITTKGRWLGDYLAYRHMVVFDFVAEVNGRADDEAKAMAASIEHFLNAETVGNLQRCTTLLKRMR